MWMAWDHKSCWCVGGSNEAVSYVKDIQAYRPNDLSLMEQVFEVFDRLHYFQEEANLLSSLMKEMTTKDEGYACLLLRSVRVNRSLRQFKTALRQLEQYHTLTSKREVELLQSLRKEVQEDNSLAERAVALLDQSMVLPEVPSSLFKLQYSLQSIRHNPSLISRFMLQITPETFEKLFEKADMDSEPYENVIINLFNIIQ